MNFNLIRKVFLSVLLLTGSMSQAAIVHEYDVSVENFNFWGPDSYSLNELTNPNDIFYKIMYIDPFTIRSGEQHDFRFRFDKTIWLYDLGLPFGELFGKNGESFGATLGFNNISGNNSLSMDTPDLSYALVGYDSKYNPAVWNYLPRTPGFGGSGVALGAWTDITSNAFGINEILVSFRADNVIYYGDSDIFNQVHLQIIGDHVSLIGPVAVSESSTFLLLLGGLFLLRRKLVN